MTGNTFAHHAHEDAAGREYFHHSSGQRINTNAVLVEALRKQYPGFDLIIAPLGSLNLIAYASAGHAVATPLEDSVNDPVYSTALKWRRYAPPPRRLDDQPGVMVENVQFGKYLYKWNHQEIILYVANCRDGSSSYPDLTYHYIITRDTHKADDLIKEATVWGTQLHDEVWVFDQGFWQKSRELWESVQKSNWENVILEEGMKKAIIADVDNFFDNRDTYTKLKVPWKRGIIYYGPPGNGNSCFPPVQRHGILIPSN
jgi:transitional endoplasmic reticulum ATPase